MTVENWRTFHHPLELHPVISKLHPSKAVFAWQLKIDMRSITRSNYILCRFSRDNWKQTCVPSPPQNTNFETYTWIAKFLKHCCTRLNWFCRKQSIDISSRLKKFRNCYVKMAVSIDLLAALDKLDNVIRNQHFPNVTKWERYAFLF